MAIKTTELRIGEVLAQEIADDERFTTIEGPDGGAYVLIPNSPVSEQLALLLVEFLKTVEGMK